ncbi:MAG: thiamine-phosphate kinase [Verrucomicrobiota bacterium]
MREFELISRLVPLLPRNDFVVAGAGDDCAVLDLGDPACHTLFKTDAIVQGVHFEAEADPEKVGHKAMARALSDVAAMAGLPVAAVVTLALPAGQDAAWAEAVYRGLCRTAARWQVAVVGGETVTNPGHAWLSVALLGRVERGKAVMRSGARAGDALMVSGELGGSIAGHHLEFEPRLREAAWLAAHHDVHAMIDLSDGLAGDLRHVLAASGGLGAEILAKALPIRAAARARAREGDLARPAVLAALTDGEDFELLFAVAPGDAVRVMDGWRQAFPGTPIHCVGKVTSGPGAWLRDSRGLRPLPSGGYEHLG